MPTAKPATKAIPMWVWIAGGGVVLLVLLLNRGRGGGGVSPDTSGLIASEVATRLDRQREDTEAALAAARADLTDLLDSRLEALVTKGNLAPIRAAPAEATVLQASLLQRILDQLTKLTTPAEAPANPAEPPASVVPLPSMATIQDWARGINLPVEWGYWFVNTFGRLPSSIPELERWRNERAIPSGSGWCLPTGTGVWCG